MLVSDTVHLINWGSWYWERRRPKHECFNRRKKRGLKLEIRNIDIDLLDTIEKHIYS